MKNVTEESRKIRISKTSDGIALTREQIDGYVKKLETDGYSSDTLKGYRRYLDLLYQFLPGEKYISDGTLLEWKEHLTEAGYSAATANVALSAANSLMRYLGRKDLQTERVERSREIIQPELTRQEYLRLLSAARMLGKERTYLLVKVFGTIGLNVSELEYLTAEAVRAGKIVLPSGTLRIPDALKTELLHYMKEEGISSGLIFVTKNGKPLDRSAATGMVRALRYEAQVPEEKVNPRCLRKLCQTTQAGIRDNFTVLVERAYDRLLEQEQRVYGWKSE